MLVRVQLPGGEVLVPAESLEAMIHDGRILPETPIFVSGAWTAARSHPSWAAAHAGAESALRSAWIAARIPWGTALLVGLVLRGHALALVVPGGRDMVAGARRDASVLENGEWWRLLAYAVPHSGLPHIAANLVFLAYVGVTLERVIHGADLVLVALWAIVGGGLLSAWLTPQVSAVGVSAADFGLAAAFVVFGARFADQLPARGRSRFGWFLAAYAGVALLNGWSAERVDNFAHLGGALAGGLVGALVRPEVGAWRRGAWTRRAATAVALGAVLAVVGAKGPSMIAMTTREVAGVELRVPAHWREGVAPDGSPGWTSAGGQVVVAARRVAMPVAATVDELRAEVVDGFRALDESATVEHVGPDAVRVRYRARGGPRTAYARVAVVPGASLAALVDGDDTYARLRERLVREVERHGVAGGGLAGAAAGI